MVVDTERTDEGVTTTNVRQDVSPDPARVERVLAWAPWAVMAVCALVALASRPDGSAPDDVLLPGMALLFGLLVVRVVVALTRWRSRRAGLSALLLGLLLWCSGSAVLANGLGAGELAFPSPGETLFLAAAVAFAAFLVLDADRRSAVDLSVWLDAVILCGGGGVLVSLALLAPAVVSDQPGDSALFVALLFPVIDGMLALLVLGQMALRARAVSRRNAYLVLGFSMLAAADASLAWSAGSGEYGFTLVLDLMWGSALVLIVAGGCRPRDTPPQGRREVPAGLVTSFAALALVVLVALVLVPTGRYGVYLAVPATLTLVAVGVRLVLALRDARDAAESYRLAGTDDLTGLPNRRALLRRLEDHLHRGDAVSLLLFDLDGFKEVNDSLGHGAGDEVLQVVATRLRDATPPTRFLARLGGDEFAVITPSVTRDRCLADAADVRAALASPVHVSGLAWSIHASVGVGTAQDSGTTASDLLRQADVAMYEAKRTRAGTAVYEADRDVFTRHRLQLADELRRGIDSGELELWYQPQLDAITLDVVGVEALARWQHPVEGLIPPAVFLPVARRAGLMPALSVEVARLAVAQARAWVGSGGPARIAMNVAPPELLRGPLLATLYDLLDESWLPPHVVALEVTEDSFLNDPDRARELLVEADRHGLATSIDDFGTGFSSLSYLRDLPVRELKIDRSFVADVVDDTRSRLIVESTVRMAHALGMLTVAEGVENDATHQVLQALGVDRVQGYLYARPMPAAQLDRWLHSHAARRAPQRTG